MTTSKAQDYATGMVERINRELPGLDPALAQLYALLVLTKGTSTTLEDVHDAWAIWTATTRGHHRSLIPFAELTREVQDLDQEYMDGIHRAASK
jgi:hypothetical protein